MDNDMQVNGTYWAKPRTVEDILEEIRIEKLRRIELLKELIDLTGEV